MKKLIIPIAILIFSGTFLSCEKEYSSILDFKADTTLAGSVIFDAQQMDVEGTFDSTELGAVPYYSSIFSVNKVSDSVISLRCTYRFDSQDGEATIISIPKIPITGRPFDVAFNHASSEVTVQYRNTEYTSVLTSVKGWIKDIDHLKKVQSVNNYATKTSPVMHSFDYQIDVTCVLDGKILNITTTMDEQKFPNSNLSLR